MNKKTIGLIVIIFLIVILLGGANLFFGSEQENNETPPETGQTEPSLQEEVGQTVNKVLSSKSQSIPAIPEGTKLLGVEINKDKAKKKVRITLDFSQELMSQGVEGAVDSMRQVTTKINNSDLYSDNPWIKSTEYMVLIEGTPLSEFGRQQ